MNVTTAFITRPPQLLRDSAFSWEAFTGVPCGRPRRSRLRTALEHTKQSTQSALLSNAVTRALAKEAICNIVLGLDGTQHLTAAAERTSEVGAGCNTACTPRVHVDQDRVEVFARLLRFCDSAIDAISIPSAAIWPTPERPNCVGAGVGRLLHRSVAELLHTCSHALRIATAPWRVGWTVPRLA